MASLKLLTLFALICIAASVAAEWTDHLLQVEPEDELFDEGESYQSQYRPVRRVNQRRRNFRPQSEHEDPEEVHISKHRRGHVGGQRGRLASLRQNRGRTNKMVRDQRQRSRGIPVYSQRGRFPEERLQRGSGPLQNPHAVRLGRDTYNFHFGKKKKKRRCTGKGNKKVCKLVKPRTTPKPDPSAVEGSEEQDEQDEVDELDDKDVTNGRGNDPGTEYIDDEAVDAQNSGKVDDSDETVIPKYKTTEATTAKSKGGRAIEGTTEVPPEDANATTAASDDAEATTEDAEATTEDAEATTEASDDATTEDPDSTTEGSDAEATTEDAEATTEDAEATTEDAEATTEDAEATTEDPEATTEASDDATTEDPDSTTEGSDPEATTDGS